MDFFSFEVSVNELALHFIKCIFLGIYTAYKEVFQKKTAYKVVLY